MSDQTKSGSIDEQDPGPRKSGKFKRVRKWLIVAVKVYAVLLVIATLASFPAVRAMLYPLLGLTHQYFQFRDYSPLFTTAEKPSFLADVCGFTNYEVRIYKADEVNQLSEDYRADPHRYRETELDYKRIFDGNNHFENLKPVHRAVGSVESYDAQKAEARVTFSNPMKPGEYMAVIGDLGHHQQGESTGFARFIVTDLGAIVKHDGNKMLVSTVNLITKKPWPSANLQVVYANQWGGTISKIETDAQGLGAITRPSNVSKDEWQQAAIEASSGDNHAFFGPFQIYGQHQSNEGLQTNFYRYAGSRYRTFFETDRPVYRIGQTINFKGLIRKLTDQGIANTLIGTAIKVSVLDPGGSVLKDFDLHTDSVGAFKGQLSANEISKTGAYQLQVSYPDSESETFTIIVEQYRKPDFKIDVIPQRERFSRGDKIRFNIQANYYFGAPLKDAKIKFHVNSFADSESKNRLKTVSTADSAFFANFPGDSRFRLYGGGGGVQKDGELVTDATGKAVLEFEAPPEVAKFDGPYTANYLDDTFNVSVEATDLSRKTFSAEGSVPVSRGDFALLVDTPRSVLKANENFVANVTVLDYKKNPVKSQKVKVTLSRWDYQRKPLELQGTSKQVIVSTVEVITDEKGHATASFTPTKDFVSTNYYLNAEAVDSKKRTVGDVTTVVYASDSHEWYYDRAQEQEQFGIELDKDVYHPGDTVRAVVKAPIVQGHEAYVLATMEGASLRSYKQIKMNGPVTVVEFPLDSTYMPNTFIGASLLLDNHKPFNVEQLVKVSPLSNFVDLQLATDKARYHPGDTVKYTVSAKNKQGSPVAGMQLCASVVDEGIFAVIDLMKREGRYYGQAEDIYHSIYRMIENEVGTGFTFMEANSATSIRGPVFDAVGLNFLHFPILVFFNHGYDGETYACKGIAMGAPGAGGAVMERANTFSDNLSAQSGDATAVMPAGESVRQAPQVPVPRTRSNFNDAAAWYPSLVTGPSGTATFSVKLPDDLTTWRATVNGITSKINVGSGSTSVTASQDFLARLALPRFYTEYDETTISGLVHNLSPTEQSVDVSLSVTPNIQLLDPSIASLKIAKDGVKRQSWRIKVLKAGDATVTLKALGSTLADAEERKLPIRTFGYRVFFAKNGLIKDENGEKIFPVVIPPDAKLATGHFDIATSASSIGPVLGSFESLISYPYGCTEQTLSKLIPSVVAMRLHKNLGVEIPEAMNAKFQNAYELAMPKLTEYQHQDGGWGWWRSDTSNAYMTAHVLEGFYLLKQAGMMVDQGQIDRGRQYLKSKIVELSGNPWDRYNSEDHAKAVYVMSLFGDKLDPLTRTWQLLNLKKMSPEALSYLTMAFRNVKDETGCLKTYERLKELRNDSLEYANWDHTTEMLTKLGLENQYDYSYRFTGVETTALALRATVMMEPKNEALLDNVTRWLVLEHDENGWNNTKTTTAVYLALLEKELSQSPDRTTNFVARVETLNKVIKELLFNKTFERGEQTASVPLQPKPDSIKLTKTGPGWLYYNTMFEYDRPLKPGEQPVLKSLPSDLNIHRDIFRLIPEKVAGSVETTNRLELLGDRPVTAGDVIMIRVTVDCPFSVPYVLLECALPSGGEVLQAPPPLTPSQKIDSIASDSWNWWTHQDILDDKVAYFATSMPAGKSVFRTFVRMEMPGKFNINPVNMEAMYTKKVRARSAAHAVRVID